MASSPRLTVSSALVPELLDSGDCSCCWSGVFCFWFCVLLMEMFLWFRPSIQIRGHGMAFLMQSVVMPSSVVRYFQYEPASLRLRVYFLSGAIYDYMDVPEEVYLKMRQSRSKGSFLNKHVKGKYQFEKIKE